MKTAKDTPASYNKKSSPAWFSAEVCSYKEYGTIRYAGQMTTAHLYYVYTCNAELEVNPEHFLMAKPADSSSPHSAGRALLDSGLVDLAFWESFNTRNVGRPSSA